MANISTCKDNQAMTFDQIIKYDKRKIFLEKNHSQNAVEILFPDPFVKNQYISGLSQSISLGQ